VAEETEHPALSALRRRLEDEEAAYAEALAALDRLAAVPLPEETGPEVRDLLGELNGLWETAPRPGGSGLGAAIDRRILDVVEPGAERQARFNAVLVRLLNAHLEHGFRHRAALRALLEAQVRFAQRVEPVMDARDQARVATAPTDAQVLLQTFERRLDAMRERVDALLALRDRVELVSEEVRAVRAGLSAAAPPPEVAHAARRAAEDSVYTAFENRFRGSREAIRERQASYVALFSGLSPVVDLGCGRGEFLDLLRAAGIEGRGVEGNARAVGECREKGLDVVSGDLVDFLRAQGPGTLGGAFAAQVVEHLPPPALAALLAEAHRALRPGGLLVLETVNAASALAFHEVYIRDLTHERPLHPETLRFLAAAAGFAEVKVEMHSPVPEDVRLSLLPSGALPPPATKVLNENAERLNALLFAPLDYAVIARR
jgi:O-antigen chain-terminating methyltransferase